MKELNYLDITKTWKDDFDIIQQGHIKVPSATGIHPDMGVGTAQQIQTNIHESDSTPYVFRPTPFNSTRESGEYIGVSVPWNQLCEPKAGSIRGVTITVSNGKITWSGAASSSGGRTTNAYNKLVPVVSGHKYVCISTLPVMPSTYLTQNSDTSTYFQVLAVNTFASIVSATFTGDAFLGHSFVNGTDYSGSGYIILTDLTLALGSNIADYIYGLESGTAGAGIAKLREWGFFDKPYYAYNAGSIESVNVSKHRMVGFNQFDKTTAVNDSWIDASTGAFASKSNAWRSDYIRCFPSTTYYLSGLSTVHQTRISFYDSNKGYISRTGAGSTGYISTTTPANCYYMAFTTYDSTAFTYDTDSVCLSVSGAKNGTYEPYTVNEYPLDSDLTLRGILKLDGSNNLYADGDVYHSDGTVDVNYGIVDLGTLEWTYSASNTRFITTGIADLISRPANNSSAGDIICAIYVNTDQVNLVSVADNMLIAVAGTSGGISVRNTSYTDPDVFKTAMSGVYLCYKLATPTTDTASPFQSPQVCSPYGTEEFVDAGVAAGTRDVAIPAGHNTEYMKNIVGAIEGIPLPPSANGTYTLKVTVASGVPTYSWVSE